MAERIGLSKNVKLEWMNLAADQHLLGKTQIEAMPVIDEKIHESIKCQANVRTIRAILMNMWFKNQDWFLDKATDVTRGISENERLAVHWALMLVRYPFFYDLCSAIGGLFEFRDEITIDQIRNRVFDKWGARATLKPGLSQVIHMLKDLNILNPVKPAGTYTHNSVLVSDVNIMQLLCAATIKASGKEYMTWENITQHPALFSFKIDGVTQADMASCEHLCLERMGDDVVIRVLQN